MFSKKAGLIGRLCNLAGDPTATETSLRLTSGDAHLSEAVQKKRIFRKLFNLFACGRCCMNEQENQTDFIRFVKQILYQLNFNQLRTLYHSVGSAGGISDSCIVLKLQKISKKTYHKKSIRAGSLAEWAFLAPHLILCLAFRWHDELNRNASTLQQLSDCLISLQYCHIQNDSNTVCVNPYHWTLIDQFSVSNKNCDLIYEDDQDIMLIDSIFIPQVSQKHRYVFPDFSCQNTKQTTIQNTTSTESSANNRWGVHYIENRQSESRTFTLDRNNSLEICSKLPKKKQEGVQQMILRSKQNDNQTDNLAKKVRDRIGFGIVLIVDANKDIWLYNRSQLPVFVCSFSANILPTESILTLNPDILKEPFKIFPGHMARVFKASAYERLYSELQSLSGCLRENLSQTIVNHFDKQCTFTLSFGRGFGRAYASREIMNCPCWVQFSRCSEQHQWGDL